MKVSYNKLTELTGMTYRTLKRRLKGIDPVSYGANRAYYFESVSVLPVLYGKVGKDETEDRLDGPAEKAKLDKARRVAQELKNKELEGELVSVEEVNRELFSKGRQIRDTILSIPARLSAGLVVETDQHRIEMTLVDELNKALEALSNDITGAG
jgi:phage terminase Nu1 subunit (DNA packaging protein)